MKWEADGAADKYNIMRSVYGENGLGAFSIIHSGAGTHYIDRDINAGSTYAYRLDKMRGDKLFEGEEFVFYFKTRGAPFQDAVMFERQEGDRAVALSWLADAGADSYILARRVEAEGVQGDFLDIYQGNGVFYIDNDIRGAVVYAYRLDKTRDGGRITGEALTHFSRAKPFSGTLSAQTLDGGRTVYVSWQADKNTDFYILHKAEITEDGIDFTDAGRSQQFRFQNETSWIDTAISNEMSYAYRLDKERGGEVIEGAEIAIFGKTRPDIFSGVVEAVYLSGGGSVYLSWEADAGADSYIVKRTEFSSGGVNFDDAGKTVTKE
ncbi:MAG: hypothetical protein LBU18_00955, partial [Treponema sp.]|nr:hypothetical protein [Treponema sp.]